MMMMRISNLINIKIIFHIIQKKRNIVSGKEKMYECYFKNVEKKYHLSF